MRKFLLLLMFCPFTVIAQEQVEGIKFVSGLSWKEIQAKAKAENKCIFVDCFTTWCGPCKWMSKNIFVTKEVGDFFNNHFISVAAQMDKTSKDSGETKNWYEDADEISNKYQIYEFPTYLFFAPNGNEIHRVAGSTKTAEEFISIGQDALNPTKQYYNIVNHWQEHRRDSAYLLNAERAALKLLDSAGAYDIGNSYLDCLADLFMPENIRFIFELIHLSNDSKDKWFQFYLRNVSTINQLMNDTSFVQESLKYIIFNEEIAPFFVKNEYPINWVNISEGIKTKYPQLGNELLRELKYGFSVQIKKQIRNLANYKAGAPLANWKYVAKKIKREVEGFELPRILLEEEVSYYSYKKIWNPTSKASLILLRKFGNELGERETNNICWDYIFEHCENRKIIREAVKWMKYYVDYYLNLDSNNLYVAANVDTYANLLFKLGKTNDALTWEKKAIEIQENNLSNRDFQKKDLDAFKTNLKKMEAGIPTWGTP